MLAEDVAIFLLYLLYMYMYTRIIACSFYIIQEMGKNILKIDNNNRNSFLCILFFFLFCLQKRRAKTTHILIPFSWTTRPITTNFGTNCDFVINVILVCLKNWPSARWIAKLHLQLLRIFFSKTKPLIQPYMKQKGLALSSSRGNNSKTSLLYVRNVAIGPFFIIRV